MSQRKFSIITINYNNKEGLRKTIESVVGQSFRDFEYIIIDGGSTDGSIEVIKEYAGKVDYWVSEPDKGIYHAMNKGVQDYFKETYGRETHFIPNGVNRPQIREASLITDKFGLKKDSYILFLGRLVPEKGIRYLVEAFKNVKTDKKLVIAGGSSDTDSFMEELKELAKGDDRILFTGFVQGAMLDELYSNAYIYTLPSDLEGMPLSLLEAMSYGNCCLVSDIPECTEVVEDKALIFKKSDVENLREKLQDACDHPEMVMKMKNQAADFICAKYNWDEVVKETMKLYRRK